MPNQENLKTGQTAEATGQSEQVDNPADLLRQRQELFERLNDPKMVLYSDHRKLVLRILEHSVEDGLIAAKITNLEPHTVISLITDTGFIAKHQQFAAKLANELGKYRHAVSEENRRSLDRWIIKGLTADNSPEGTAFQPLAIEQLENRLDTPQAIQLLHEIDQYYAKLLVQRQVRPKAPESDSSSPGERRAADHLHQIERAMAGELHSGIVQDTLLTQLTEAFDDDDLEEIYLIHIRPYLERQFPDAASFIQALREGKLDEQAKRYAVRGLYQERVQVLTEDVNDEHWDEITKQAIAGQELLERALESNLISQQDALNIFDSVHLDIPDELTNAEYQPLGLTAEFESQEVQRLLKEELLELLRKRGYAKAQTVWNEGKGEYAVSLGERAAQRTEQNWIELGQSHIAWARELQERPDWEERRLDLNHYGNIDDAFAVAGKPFAVVWDQDSKMRLVRPNGEVSEAYEDIDQVLPVGEGVAFRAELKGFDQMVVVHPDGHESQPARGIPELKVIAGEVYHIERRGHRGNASEVVVVDASGNESTNFLEVKNLVGFQGQVYFVGRSSEGSALYRMGEEQKRCSEFFDDLCPAVVKGELLFATSQTSTKAWQLDFHGVNTSEKRPGYQMVLGAIELDGKVAWHVVKAHGGDAFALPGGKESPGFHDIEVREQAGRTVTYGIKDGYTYIYPDGRQSIRYSFLEPDVGFTDQGAPAFAASREDGQWVIAYPNGEESAPYDDVGSPRYLDDVWFFPAKRANGYWYLMNEFDEVAAGPFDGELSLEVDDERVTLMTVDKGKAEVIVRSKVFKGKSAPTGSLNEEERGKLNLLNLTAKPTLQGIRGYYGSPDDPDYQQRLTERERLEHSEAAASTVNQMLKEHPVVFLSTIPAKKDNLADWNIRRIVYTLFPEIPVNLAKQEQERQEKLGLPSFGNGERQQQPQNLLQPKESLEVRDGDPKEQAPKEVLRFREPVHGFLATRILAKCNAENGIWAEAEFPIAPQLSEPTEELTATLPTVKGLERTLLPTFLNSQVLPDRVKGITTDGEEVRLPVERRANGQAQALLTDGVDQVVYSQAMPEIMPVPQDLAKTDYERFQKQFERDNGKILNEPLADLPEEIELVLESVKGKSLKEQLAGIEQMVRELCYYDLDNVQAQGRKQGKSIAERLAVAQDRLGEIMAAKPELAGKLKGKRFAGVCADANMLLVAMLRKAGFLAGLANGFRANGTSVTTADSHGIAYALWPTASGDGCQIIPLDGTPAGLTAEEQAIIGPMQQPSLIEREQQVETRKAEFTKIAEQKLQAILATAQGQDVEAIRKLSNGDLEGVLNAILKLEVKQSHLAVIDRILNAARYSPLKLDQVDFSDPEQAVDFRSFIEQEIGLERGEVAKNGAAGERGAGSYLLKTIGEFADRFARDAPGQQRERVFNILDQLVDAARPYLNPVEQRAAVAVITYLRAKRMATSELKIEN